MLNGTVTSDFPVYTDKLVVIKEGTRVTLNCTNGLIGEWKVATADQVWTMGSGRMRKVISIDD